MVGVAGMQTKLTSSKDLSLAPRFVSMAVNEILFWFSVDLLFNCTVVCEHHLIIALSTALIKSTVQRITTKL